MILAIFWTLFCLASSAPASPKDAKVLILGGGAAGLSAAKTLMDNNVDDFILLEGSDRLRGRVRSVEFAGKTVEAGANWIVGKEGNPMYHTSLEMELQGKWSDWDNVVVRNSAGEDVTDTDADDSWTRLEEAHDSMAEVIKRMDGDMSMRACLGAAGWRPRSPVDNAVEIYDYDFEYGSPPDVGSCSSIDKTKELVDEVYYVCDKRGYESLLKSYFEDVSEDDPRVYLNEIVISVERIGSKVRVTTTNKNQYTADYAIITFSVGVLQSGLVEFTPPLPSWKVDNLARVRFEKYFGIYMTFPGSRFWDDSDFVLYADERRSYFPIFVNLESEGLASAGSNILEVVAVGEDAERVSRLSDAEVQEEVMALLRRVYKNKKVPDPDDILVPDWVRNPLYLGSFPNLEPGADNPAIFDAIRAPVERLYFAGDSCDEDLVGYVYGAIRSGGTVAAQVAEKLS